jgi:O-antigen/teichoic acid export membrane protein
VPVYTSFLMPEDYANLGLLVLFGTLAKIAFRLGLDAGFFRVYYDQPEGSRRRFAGSVAAFSAATSTLLFLLVILLREPLARAFQLTEGGPLWIVLAAADVYFAAFSYVPQGLLRIEDRSRAFAAFAIVRHATNALLKVLLLAFGHGITGVVASDAAASLLFALLLLPTLRRGASWGFERAALVEALRFGLPKLPHGLLLQLQNLADRWILAAFAERAAVGLYHQGYTLGQGVKFALAAFEPAWQPFVYAQIGRPEAPRNIARIVTYVWAAFLALGLAVAVLGRELLVALTFRNPAFWPAASIVPVVVLAYLLHGAFLLTSIGIAIEKRARYYPLITLVAASTNIGLNLVLIPGWGMLGAAWATVASYAAMAFLGYRLSQGLYPIPFETGRLARLSFSALGCFALSRLVPEPLLSPSLWSGLALSVAWKLLALAAFPVLVAASGFLRPEERARLRLG